MGCVDVNEWLEATIELADVALCEWRVDVNKVAAKVAADRVALHTGRVDIKDCYDLLEAMGCCAQKWARG